VGRVPYKTNISQLRFGLILPWTLIWWQCSSNSVLQKYMLENDVICFPLYHNTW